MRGGGGGEEFYIDLKSQLILSYIKLYRDALFYHHLFINDENYFV